jgi:hypothetical protein
MAKLITFRTRKPFLFATRFSNTTFLAILYLNIMIIRMLLHHDAYLVHYFIHNDITVVGLGVLFYGLTYGVPVVLINCQILRRWLAETTAISHIQGHFLGRGWYACVLTYLQKRQCVELLFLLYCQRNRTTLHLPRLLLRVLVGLRSRLYVGLRSRLHVDQIGWELTHLELLVCRSNVMVAMTNWSLHEHSFLFGPLFPGPSLALRNRNVPAFLGFLDFRKPANKDLAPLYMCWE